LEAVPPSQPEDAPCCGHRNPLIVDLKYLDVDKFNNMNLPYLYIVADITGAVKEVDVIRGHVVGLRICTAYYLEILKVRKHLGDPYVDG
jgi:hypothetical protein